MNPAANSAMVSRRVRGLCALVAAAAWIGCNGDNGGAPPVMPPTPTVTPAPTPVLPPPGAGVSSAITNAVVASEPAGQITVTFTLTDASGVPITPVLTSTQDPRQARVRFTIAHVEEYSGGGEFRTVFTRYVNDVNATRPRYDSNGTLETADAAAGVYRYRFNTMLPANFDRTRTYSVGLQVDRSFGGQQLSANPVFDFVPAGGAPQIRAGSATERCNTCHDPLVLHGNRREFRLCTLCHAEAAVDEKGRSIELRDMIHKIHRGKDLPSIVDGPPGAAYGIFSSFRQSDIVFARKDAEGHISGVGFPRNLRDCDVCHAAGETAALYLTRPSSSACSACHDDVNPSLAETAAGPPGTGHFQNKGFADGDCAFCHVADSEREFDISVKGAHVVPERSAQLAGLNIEITGVSNHGPGQTPTFAFKVADNGGTPLRDLSGLNRLAFTINGPTSDYATVQVATAVGGGAAGVLTGPGADGVFQYTPPQGLPADARGTWAVGIEARRAVELGTAEGGTRSVNEAAANPVVTFSVGSGMPLARRVVVEDQKCGACHGEFSRGFSIHGNLRNQIEYCVLCHNPNNTDFGRRGRDPAAVARGELTASIDFKFMIHRIHTGEELTQKPYLIYGFGPPPQNFTIHDFAELLFPGDRRNCQACHASGTNLLPPFPGTARGTLVTRLDPATGDQVDVGRISPITSVCTSCHDSDAAAAHAETQTAAMGREACAVCHGEGREVAVSKAHAR